MNKAHTGLLMRGGSILFLLFAIRYSLFASPEQWGVLVLAHGGNPEWNARVEKAMRAADIPHPSEIAFGMAVGPAEYSQIYGAIGRLKEHGADRVVVVPFLVSSHSEVYRQYEYVLRLRETPGFSEMEIQAMATMGSASHMMPVAARRGPGKSDGAHGAQHVHGAGGIIPPKPLPIPVTLTKALDDSPELVEVLAARVREVSKKPAAEEIVLVAHGPNDEGDNTVWMDTLGRRLGPAIVKRIGVEAWKESTGRVWAVTLREDAPPPVREKGTQHLRSLIDEIRARGRTPLVIPVLISSGGIERGIVQRLKGQHYKMAKPLLPHSALSAWISRRVKDTVEAKPK